MDAQTFLDSFATIADSPGGVPRLRALVLDLAVIGRLVEQDPRDEPAQVLIGGMRERRDAMVADGTIGKPRHPEGVPVDEPPHEIPPTWAWVRVGDVGAIVGGGTPKSGEPRYWADGPDIPWLTPADMRSQASRLVSHGARDITAAGLSESSAQLLPPGTVLFSSRAPIGHVGIAAQPLATNQGFKSCIPYVSAMTAYLYVFLRQVGPSVDVAATGTTFKEVSGKDVALIPVPVPPLAEQERIVPKVDELMGLCDELEARQERRQRATTRFRGSALHALAAADTPDDLRHAWVRVNTNWPALTDQPDSLDALRHVILQLAITGALTDRFGAVGEGGFGEQNNGSQRGEFPLPDGWAWQEFGELCERITVGHVGPMANRYVTSGIPFLRSQNVGRFRYDPTNLKYIDPDFHAELEKSALVGGEVISVRSGNVGRTCVFPVGEGPANCADLVIMRVSAQLDAHYAAIVMNSPYGADHVSSKKVGIAQAHFNVGSAKRMPTPVPPIEVQRDLVQLVHHFLAACDDIESLLRRQSLRAEHLAAAAPRMAYVGN